MMPASETWVGLAETENEDAVLSPAALQTPSATESGSPAVTARIGPNALVQTGQALSALFGETTARALFERAGLIDRYTAAPRVMLDEAEPRRLFNVLCEDLSPVDSVQVLADAGHRTGHYLLTNRIPKPARWLLPRLPLGLSTRILVRAIAAHSWTFAGSGRFRGHVEAWRRPVVRLVIWSNPLATPGCPWHGAVFERLFATLTASHVTVSHPRCSARGDDCCEWTITPSAGPLPRARSCPRDGADRPDREDRL
ncbi:bacteriochlorophyll 4-vinyl reductase [Rhizobium glycinendophyticum]|uniref:Bacteriochlorophyll 4-vinyl reductase n=1 Tax=Rhizobium glycinendophyticum TaxID=2589807 RepID=A0A504UQJ5_9HYPH|nr:bacteriochlorophyll 4-vinyl reductase [Rhizobium glycinendophyticum]TPP11086.1 bacteriochlorophyll 4-vinyl reductase [Rhizobium glycinendophyticum]